MTYTKDYGLTKYAVDEQSYDTYHKTAQQGRQICPECGREAEVHGKVLLCPIHGSDPFER